MSERTRRLFVPPPPALFEDYGEGSSGYVGGYGTYTAYNYASGSPASFVKRLHFEVALRLVRDRFGGDAIDFGCADGVFLPSAGRWFDRVTAVDNDSAFLAHAQFVVDQMGLANVTTIDNSQLGWPEMRSRIARPAGTLFLLETLEHLGDADDLYPSKMRFLHELFSLLDDDGVIVISVPVMVGLPFLAQRAVLRILNMQREELTKRQLFDLGVRRNSDALEPDWVSWRHLGFNHRKLERHMEAEFRLHAKRSLGVSQVYVIGRR